ncbi:podocalyxin-like protein 2 isoform X2 [Kryptolebias marmoratus]|uniref:Podocalyxin like 2 n=1 Tax=Kryptolebias marmoratus TaxID=37003 RepID=A0A3Q3APY5_KRYMA|nr:podocalyxin-like protein 2 isoform X2 [Kryptolebias marmoratus]
MPGLLFTLTALLVSCESFGSSQRVIPLRPPLFANRSPAKSRFIQELVRTKRHSVSELVRAQPHLVHDMGWPEIHDVSRSQTQVDSANPSQMKPSAGQEVARPFAAAGGGPDEEDVMERMVYLAAPQDPDGYGGHDGPGAGDASQEASGFYGMDTEDRERGEEGGEDQERREGEEEWETEAAEDRERREGDAAEEEDKTRGGGTGGHSVPEVLEVNHTTPDLDALIGYTSSLHPPKDLSSSFRSEDQDSGLQEQRGPPVLEVETSETELWEADRDGDVQSSGGFGLLRSSVSASPSPAAASSTAVPDVSREDAGTATPETDTGTDFGLLGTKEETEKKESGVITQNPTAPEVGSAPSREPLQPVLEEEERWGRGEQNLKGFGLRDKSEELEEEKTRVRQIVPLTTDPSPTIGFTETESSLEGPRQVVCLNWSELAGRGYVVLNMSKNMNCEEFRVYQGVQLLKIIERVFARRMNSPEGSWVIYLSKPTHQQHQLLMNVASGHGVIATQEVLNMLGEIEKSLYKVGIQDYSPAATCQTRPSKTRSDYGKLFVVLVIIGAVCMIIITSGFIYICWQRRLPALKTMFPAEELHSVENGYHDNPTLDVTNDSQPEMKEKKPSTNGLSAAGGGGGGGGGRGEEDSSRWQAFVNQAATEDDEEEQDTHL